MRKPGLYRDKGRLFGRRNNKVTKVPIIPLEGGRGRQGGGKQKKGHFCDEIGNFGDENRELFDLGTFMTCIGNLSYVTRGLL